jgi:hypothetical protein
MMDCSFTFGEGNRNLFYLPMSVHLPSKLYFKGAASSSLGKTLLGREGLNPYKRLLKTFKC